MIEFGRQNIISTFDRGSGALQPHILKAPLSSSGELWSQLSGAGGKLQTPAQKKAESPAGKRLVTLPSATLALAKQQPLLRYLMPTEVGCCTSAQGHRCARERGSSQTLFLYCSAGSGWCELAGRTFEITKNQLLVIPAGIAHAYGASKSTPWTVHWFQAQGEAAPLYLESLGVKPESPVVRLGYNLQLFSLFEDILQQLEQGANLAHLTYAAHALVHLLGIILRCKEESWQEEANSRERILKSIEFMKEHLREPLQISRLAAVVNLSKSYYTALFRRVIGCAPLMFLNQMRMETAAQMLLTTSLPIKTISDQLGFSEQNYFSRAFTKLHGLPPSEYRRRSGQVALAPACGSIAA